MDSLFKYPKRKRK